MHVPLDSILDGLCPTVVSLNDVCSHELEILGVIGLLTFELRGIELECYLALGDPGTKFGFELSKVFFFLVDPVVWLFSAGKQFGCEAQVPSPGS